MPLRVAKLNCTIYRAETLERAATNAPQASLLSLVVPSTIWVDN